VDVNNKQERGVDEVSITKQNVPLLAACIGGNCRQTGISGQLQRVYFTVPNWPDVWITPKVKFAESNKTFGLEKMKLPNDGFMVLRLPYIYEGIKSGFQVAGGVFCLNLEVEGEK